MAQRRELLNPVTSGGVSAACPTRLMGSHHLGVLLRQLMSILAVRSFESLTNLARNGVFVAYPAALIFKGRNRLQVVRIDAGSVSAKMIKLKAFRDWPLCQFEGQSMSELSSGGAVFVAHFNFSISAPSFCSGPRVATRRLDFGESLKSFLDGLKQAFSHVTGIVAHQYFNGVN